MVERTRRLGSATWPGLSCPPGIVGLLGCSVVVGGDDLVVDLGGASGGRHVGRNPPEDPVGAANMFVVEEVPCCTVLADRCCNLAQEGRQT